MKARYIVFFTMLMLLALPGMAQSAAGGVEVDYNNPKKYIVGGVKFVMPVEIHSMEHKTSDFAGEVREKLVKKLTR